MESGSAPPPLPPNEPVPEPPPPPPSSPPSPPPLPPPSMQTSNQSSDGLDFDSDVGGLCQPVGDQEVITNGVPEVASLSEMPQDQAAVATSTQRKRKAPIEEQSCKRTKNAEGLTDCGQAQVNNAQPSKEEKGSIRPYEGNKQEFEIIDDIGSDDEAPADYDSEYDEDEIEALLDQMLQNNQQGNSGSNEDDDFAAPVEREKIVLKERGEDPFDILPEGWVTVTHNSGMPVYLHKVSRVCTLSRPYFLGPGSARKHDIPLSAVPCLEYRRELDKEQLLKDNEQQEKDDASAIVKSESLPNGEAEKETTENTTCPGEKTDSVTSCPVANRTTPPDESSQENGNGDQNPNVRVESLEKYNKDKTLGPMELRDYCEKLFEFQTITIKKYKTWKDRRKHHKLLKHRPSLPSNTKLITCPILTNKHEDKPNKKKEFVLNPAGKSDICILHEYVQHAMRVQPRYVIKELENAQTPYSAAVIISNVEYGTGYASSKKAAKNEAAKATLGILIPDLKKQTEPNQDIHDLSFFDQVKIEDPRVHDLCNKAGQPGPFQILCECLRRNFGMGDTNCEMTMKTLKHQKSEFTMRVGKHSAQVICKNKREGKQFAAQSILQSLHPHIHNWGSLLRLYGIDWKAIKEKEEELSVTSLHAKAKQNQPNTAILNKLKEEMQKLQLRRKSMVQDLDLAVPDYVKNKPKSMVLLFHQTNEDDDLLQRKPFCGPRRSSHFTPEVEQSLLKVLTSYGSTYLKASVYIDHASICPVCGPPLPTMSSEGKSVHVNSQSENDFTPLPICKEQKSTMDKRKNALTQTSTRICKERESQTALSLLENKDIRPDTGFEMAKRVFNTKPTLSGLCECMKKILVEQSSQTDPLPAVGLKKEDKSTQHSDVAQTYQVPLDGYSQSIMAVQQMNPYGHAPIVPIPKPYMVNCPSVIVPPSSAPVTPLSTENRVARNEPDDKEVKMSADGVAELTETDAAQGEKPILQSFQAYWRATPSTYVPQDILVNAGIVPPEKRCWRASVPLDPSATLSTASSDKTKSPVKKHVAPQTSKFDPVRKGSSSDPYQNPYLVQQTDPGVKASGFRRIRSSARPVKTGRTDIFSRNPSPGPGNEPPCSTSPNTLSWDMSQRSEHLDNTRSHMSWSDGATAWSNKDFSYQSMTTEALLGQNYQYEAPPPQLHPAQHQLPPPPPGTYSYANYGRKWIW